MLGASLLEEVLPSICNGTNERLKQNDTLASYAPIIKREDEHIDFHQKASEVANKVRALYPHPLANVIIDGEEVKVLEGYIGDLTKSVPGKIIDIKKDAIGIACLDRVYYLTRIKPFGKKEMSVRDYLNGVNKEAIKMAVIE